MSVAIYSLFAGHMNVGNIYFDLAQTQQLFQTIVQLAHACPTMSCIRLVLLQRSEDPTQPQTGYKSPCY